MTVRELRAALFQITDQEAEIQVFNGTDVEEIVRIDPSPQCPEDRLVFILTDGATD